MSSSTSDYVNQCVCASVSSKQIPAQESFYLYTILKSNMNAIDKISTECLIVYKKCAVFNDIGIILP